MPHSTPRPLAIVPSAMVRFRHFAIRSLERLLFEGDLATMERGVVFFLYVWALTIVVLNARLIAIPPPAFQGNVLTLPAWVWSGFLLIGAVYWTATNSVRGRLAAVKWSFFICCALCGPLYLKALSFVVPMMFFVLFLGAVGVRLARLRQKSDAEGLGL